MNLIKVKPDGTFDEIETPHFSLIAILRNWPDQLGPVPTKDDGQLLMLQADTKVVVEMLCTVETFFRNSDITLGVMLTNTMLCLSIENDLVYWRLSRLGRHQEPKLYML